MHSLALEMVQQLVQTCEQMQQRLRASQPLSEAHTRLRFKAEDEAQAMEHDSSVTAAQPITSPGAMLAADARRKQGVLDSLRHLVQQMQGAPTVTSQLVLLKRSLAWASSVSH